MRPVKFLKMFNNLYVNVPMGTSPYVMDRGARNYAFKEENHTMRTWPFKYFKEINLHHGIGQYMPTGAVKGVPYASIWLGSSHAERCDYVTFNPKEERIFTTKHDDRL